MADEQTAAPAGTPAAPYVDEIERSEAWQRAWLDRCKAVLQRYKDERARDSTTRRFSLLWSNIETLKPAVYARTPVAVVSRRFKDADPLARASSEVLERALNYSLDAYDFDAAVMQPCRDEYLLFARGTAWARYVPVMRTVRVGLKDDGAGGMADPTGKLWDEYEEDGDGPFVNDEELDYEQVLCDHVAWEDFGTNPARTWTEVYLVWRRVLLSRDELVERFGEAAKSLPLDQTSPAAGQQQAERGEKKAAVYEVWDKRTRRAVWVSKGSPALLDEREDPLKLRDFFPCPRPMFGTLGPDSLIPVPDYALYQDQAEEIDELTARIGTLQQALRMVGVYASMEKDTLAQVFSAGKTGNELIPVDSWAALAEKGGMKGVIDWLPVDMVIQTLTGCFEARQRILEDVYQLTGISDIVRGSTDPNETATAQGIKAQWGSLRVRERQKELARFARDLIRIKGEIIAERFSIDTLKAMTNVRLLTAQEKELLAMKAQAGQPLAPAEQEAMGRPTWEEVKDLLSNDAMRQFRVEIETDSTIEPNENEEKQRRVEFATALGGLLSNALPILQQYPPAAPLIGETVKFVTRGFRVGREMEEVIERVFAGVEQLPMQPQGQPEPPPEDPAKGQAATMTAQARLMDAETKRAQAMANAQYDQVDLALKAGQQQIDAAALARDPVPQVIA